jgi:assimilatory nitrate reductase catalytic subunit
MITEKAYLLGKFARVAIGTKNIDYNGRLCMVSAGTAYKLAFNIDRSPNPWADLPQTRALLVIGANVAECAPIATSYIWQMRENGGRLMVADPRLTPIARKAICSFPFVPAPIWHCCRACSTSSFARS